MSSKASWRRHYKTRCLDFISAQDPAKLNSSLANNLKVVLRDATGVWGSFQPLAGEPDPSLATETAHKVEWAYPRISGPDLEFYVPENEQSFASGPLGIREPDPSRSRFVDEEIRGVLVPGAAFDVFGHRLGKGKGFYDRFLASKKIQKIGVAFSVQVSEEPLPTDEWDVSMDMVITEKSVFATPDASRVKG